MVCSFRVTLALLPAVVKSTYIWGIPKQFCLLQYTGNFISWVAAKKEPIVPRMTAKGVLTKRVTKYRPNVSVPAITVIYYCLLSVTINLSRKGLVKI